MRLGKHNCMFFIQIKNFFPFFQDILYQDAEIEGSTKDQEQEFESKEHPYEKDIAAAVADARSTKPPRDGSIFSGIFSGKTQHTWEKMVPDDTT